MLVHSEIHNGHREELEKITATGRGRTQKNLSSLKEVCRGFLNEDGLQAMMLKASETKPQALYYPEEEEALEERKKIKKEGKEENVFLFQTLPKDNTNSIGNPTEQLLPKVRHGNAQEGSWDIFLCLEVHQGRVSYFHC